MKHEEQERITKICKEFASGFDFPINGSGWLIVDPLSGYLSVIEGIENTCMEYPANDKHPQILTLIFPDGSRLIPAGSDFGIDGITDWFWITPEMIKIASK